MAKGFRITVGRHVASLVRSRTEIRVTDLGGGFQLHLCRTTPTGDVYNQVLPDPTGEPNPQGLYNDLQTAIQDLEYGIREADWEESVGILAPCPEEDNQL